MKLQSTSFRDGGELTSEFALADIDSANHVTFAGNRNPHLAWSDVPAGTRSFAIVCHDPDVPSRPDDVNQEGREVPETLPRVDFFHWLLLDIPADRFEIAAGSHSVKVRPGGKPGPTAPEGLRHGINDYTDWFASDAEMKGDYYGYDGPCPPWNDALMHHYVFTVYALDVAQLNVEGPSTGGNVLEAIVGHVLGKASIVGQYTLNPRLRQARTADR